MSGRPVSVFTVSMACGATLTSAIDLQRAWNKISVTVPTMTSGTDIYFQGASTLAGTYRRINHPPNSVSATAGAQFIASSITQCVIPLNQLHVQYLKVECSTAMTAVTANFDIVCSD